MQNDLSSELKLRLEYAERSKHFDLPDILEQAIEDDYVFWSHYYTPKVFELIPLYYAFNNDISPEHLLDIIRSIQARE